MNTNKNKMKSTITLLAYFITSNFKDSDDTTQPKSIRIINRPKQQQQKRKRDSYFSLHYLLSHSWRFSTICRQKLLAVSVVDIC